jgi:hypothetical protein
MTGISRKEIKKIREQEDPTRWTPAMELSPGNLLLHYWHYDEDFYQEPGVPRALPLDGEGGFTALVRRYAGDIPPGAVKEELKRAGVVDERDEAIRVMKRYFQPEELDADFIRNIAFSIRSVATTVVHNAKLVCRPDFNQHLNEREGRFERFVWSDHLGVENQDAFRCWVRTKGARFIEDADDWIGENETSKDSWNTQTGKTVGVGLYYFEDDHDNEPGAGGSR